MAWGTIELEQEVEKWLVALPDELFGQAERYIDLLADEGVHLGEPFSRQLQGKLRELRFHLGRQHTRITYRLLPMREARRLTGLSTTTLRRWTKDGRLPDRRSVGGHRMFLISDLEAFTGAP
ncbi:MAG: type II toxin-antitoxin system RelE/ParE family toxin, partial [Acidimicrobiales bacterium]